MRFPQSFLEDLRARVSVSSVVGEHVKLKRAGRELKGLSPFNKEKTASFFVNDAKQYWFDFSCGKNGSVFDFLMQVTGCGFVEAVQAIAARAGVPLPASSPEEEAAAARRAVVRDLNEAAAAYFTAQLHGPGGAAALAYLAERGLDAAACDAFRIGFAPGGDDLKRHLIGNGADLEDVLESGLVVVRDGGGPALDRFASRIMFPIADLRGRVIGFGGRALRPDQVPKYLNSPETPAFHKGHILYNGAAARHASRGGAACVVVEGYMDAIAISRAGHPAVVATMGTSITPEQLIELWRWTEDPVIMLDGDAPGARAAAKVVETALPHLGPGKSLRFATCPEGIDPDDLIRNEGREAFDSVLERAVPFARMIWQIETVEDGTSTPEKRAGLEARLRERVRAIADTAVRRHYGQEFKAALGALFKGKPVEIGARRLSRFGRVSWSEQDAPTHRQYEWLIKGILPLKQTAAMTGASGSGKTFEAFNIAGHVAMGWPYRGRRTQRGLVVYCAPEGGVGAIDRMRAFRRYHKLPLEDVPIELLPRRFNIYANEKDVSDLIEEINAIASEWEPRGVNLMLIIIDTWSAATGGMKENQGEDVGVVRGRIARIEDACDAGVMFVHHLNAAGERSRGHTSIIADIDTELRVAKLVDAKDVPVRDDDGRIVRRITVQKQREGDDGQHWDFVLSGVVVRKDEDGEEVPSCVSVEPVRPNTGTVEEKGRRRVDGVNLSSREAMFFRALLEAILVAGEAPPPVLALPGTIQKVVRWPSITKEYRRKVPSEDRENAEQYRGRIKSAMRHARQKLAEYGVIGVDQIGEGDAAVHVIWPTGKRVVGPHLVWPPAVRVVEGGAAAAAGGGGGDAEEGTLDFDALKPAGGPDREAPF